MVTIDQIRLLCVYAKGGADATMKRRGKWIAADEASDLETGEEATVSMAGEGVGRARDEAQRGARRPQDSWGRWVGTWCFKQGVG